MRVNLLPDSILQAKSTKRTRNIALIAIAAGAAVVVCGYGGMLLATTAAQGELDTVQRTNTELLAQQRSFSDASGVLSDISGVQTQLGRMLGDDVAAGPFLTALRAAVPAGVTLSSATATVPGTSTDTGREAIGGAASALDDSGLEQIGRLDLTGTAPNRAAVAAFIERLAAVTGVTVPYIVAENNGIDSTVDFTAQATLTSDLRTGRFGATGATTPATTEEGTK